MRIGVGEIDLIKVLNLDHSLSAGEIETLVDELSREIYFRLITESLPKLIPKAELTDINKRYMGSDDLSGFMDELTSKFPKIDWDHEMKNISGFLKKEFIINYLTDLKSDFADQEVRIAADDLISEINMQFIDSEKLESLSNRLAKAIDSSK